MSGRKSKKTQKLGSSRRFKNRNREIEEKESDEECPDPGHEKHDSEQSQFHTVSENQASDSSSLLHSDQPVIACTNPNTSGFELSTQPQSQDFKNLSVQADVTSKKRKMGSTRKDNRNFKFEGIFEDEPEHRVQLSEGVSDEQGVTVEASIKQDVAKEDRTSFLECAPSQSSGHESFILQGKHLALGTIMHNEDDCKNEENQHLEAALQNKPTDISSSVLNQSDNNDEPSVVEQTVHKPMDGSSLNSIIGDEQEDKHEREGVDTLEVCSGEDIGQDEVTGVLSASLINKHEHGTQIDKATTVTLQEVITKEGTENENTADHCLEPKSTEFREDIDENKEVSVVGDKTDNDLDEGVAATNLDQAMEPDRNIISPLQLSNQEVETFPNQFLSYEFKFQCDSVMKCYREEQYDHSVARCWTGESSADEDIAKKEVDMHYNEEEKYRQIGKERKVDNDDKVSLTNTLEFVTESKRIPAETLCGETVTSNQTCSLQDNPGECPTELEMQSKEGVCSDQMLDEVIIDRSEYLDLNTEVIKEEKNDMRKEINAGSRLLNEQRMAPIITKTQDDAVKKHVSLAVTKDGTESPDHESASQVNVHSTCGPAELIPEKQAMSDMQINIDNIHTVICDQNQNISEEHLENPMNSESEPEQTESTSPFVQIQESKPSQVVVIKENVEFSSSEKRRKMGSTRKSPRGQMSGSGQKNKFEEIKAKENIQEEHKDQISTNPGVSEEENNDKKEEINAGETKNFSKEDIKTGGSQQYMLCEESSQTNDVGLSTIEHLSPGTEHPDLKEDDGNSVEPIEKTNAEIHTQTQTKKKKKFGSTRKPHGRYQPHAKEEEGEWRDVEDIDEIEHQIITQAATSNLLTEIQNSMSEVSLDIHDSQVTTEQNQIIKSEVELVTGGITAQPVILSTEDDQIQCVVPDEVSNAEGLTDIIEQHEKPRINEEMDADAESTLLNDQEMETIITKPEDDAFIKDVSLAVTKDGNESPDHESASEVNVHSTCDPVELIPETQVTSDMQINIDNIHTVISDKQNISEEHPENPMDRESEPEQLESTSPFVQIQESETSQVEVMKENVEFSSCEKKSKISKAKENIKEENMEQIITNHGSTEEENNDTKEEINAGPTENFTKEDITTVGSQQYMLCELSSQITDLGLTTIEQPLPGTEHPVFKEDDGNRKEPMEKTNEEIHKQTQNKKKKKFGSTRQPHGRYQPQAKGEEGEWRDVEDTEEIENQIITQAASSNLLTKVQNTMSEVSLDIHESQVTTEQKQMINSEFEPVTGGISAQPVILSTEDDQIQTVVSDEVSNAERLSDTIEEHENPRGNEMMDADAESLLLNDQEMESLITKPEDDAFIQHVSLAVIKDGTESPDHEHASEVNVHSTYGPVELIPKTQVMSDMQINIDNIHTVISDEKQNISEEHLENPMNRESEAKQRESASPIVQIQESKPSEVEVMKENVEFSSCEKRRKMGSTRKSPRGQIPGSNQKNTFEENKAKENIQNENTDKIIANNGALNEQNNDIKEEINAGPTESFNKEDITTVGSQQYMLSELFSQITDLGLTAIEHLSPATEQPVFQEDDGNSKESMEKPHGSYQPHAKGEEGEWRDVEDTEEMEHQIITQAAISHLLTEQNQIIQSEVELVTGGISAQPVILSTEDDQIQIVVSDKVSNAEGRIDIIEQHENPRINEEMDADAESTLLNDQEMESIITKTSDDAFIKHMSLAVKKDGNESPDHERASEVNVHSTCGPVELISETQVMSDMQINIDNIHTVISDQNQKISEEHLENPVDRESEPLQLESTSPFVQIQESKPSQGDVTKENVDQIITNHGATEEENNDTKEEINSGPRENFTKEDITTGGSQQYMLCELSSQITDLGLTMIEHPSPASEHPDLKEDDGNCVESVEKTNAEIHTQAQTRKKKKLGSTRKPHGRYQRHAKGEEGEWRDVEDTEEMEHQIITQAATSNLLTEHNQIIQSEVELVTGGISAQPVILSTEDNQVQTVFSDEVSTAEGLTDIIQQHEKPRINVESGVESTLLNDQEMESIITKTQDDVFIKHVSLAVTKDGNESPDHESASEVNVHSTCGPVELIPETQAMSDMQINIDNIHTVISDQNQNISEEHLENPMNRESEPEQTESTSPFVQIQESKQSQVVVVKENVEFSNSEKRRKMGSTRKSPRGEMPGSGQKNKFEEIKANENIQEEHKDQISTNAGVNEEENNDKKEEINAGETENFSKEDITTGGSQQYMLCEVSSQANDLGLSTSEHLSPGTEHPDFKEAEGNSVEPMEKTNAEIYTQTQTKKKKKFGSTRKPHGKYKPHGKEEEGEWRDVEDIEEIEHQIISQAATSNLLTEIQNSMSEVSLDIHDSQVTTEQKQVIKSEVELVTGGITAQPVILSTEDDQIQIVVSDEVSNAEGLTDIIEQHEKPRINEEMDADAESTLSNDQEMESFITKPEDPGSPDHESATEVNVHSTCGPVELIPETQVMSDMQINIDNIHTVISDQNQNISEEHLENQVDRESEPLQLESTSPFVRIQESKPSQGDVTKENVDQIITNHGATEEENNDTDLGLTMIEHPSPASEQPDLKEDDGNCVESVEKTNAEIHTQTQTKKKKKFGSTRKPHGKYKPHGKEEEGEWRDVEDTEEIEHQIITQAATSNLLTEIQNSMSEVSLDILDSQVTTEQKQIIKSEVELVTGGISSQPVILSTEDDQIQTVVSDEVNNAQGLTDIIEQHENPSGNKEMHTDAASIRLNDQEMESIITKPEYDAFIEHVSLAVRKDGNESPIHESASEINVHSTCSPVELIPETQAMSDMQINIDNINTVTSDQNQNISEEHLENPMDRESELLQLESTSPFVQIQESKPSQVDVTKENVEFSRCEKKRMISKAKENIQEEKMDQIITNHGATEQENNDTKEEINAGPTEKFTKEDITTGGSQQNMLCELSSQITDLGLSMIEHPAPASEHPDLKEDDGNCVESVEKTNAEIHTQAQTRKKKKLGSTRKPHGRYQPHAKGEEGEWRDAEDTEEIEHQFITQAATSNLLTEIQNSMSEVSLDIHDSQMTTEQKQIIESEVELVTGGISAQPVILSTEDDEIQTVVSEEVSNAQGLTDIIEHHEKPRINEEMDAHAESILLNDQEMESIIIKSQDDAFIKHVSLAVTKDGNKSPDHESASEDNLHSTCGPVELIPETQVISDKQINIDNIHTVISDKNQNMSEEHLENPMNRESEPEHPISTSPFDQIQESKPSQVEDIKENVEFSSSEKRRKMGSTRKSPRGQMPGSGQKNTFEGIKTKENIQEENTDQKITNNGAFKEENNDIKEEINAGPTESFNKEDITTVGLQQYMLCELSSQITDLGLTTIEHPSPATEQPDLKQDDGNSLEPMEKTNAQISMQTQTKKKKKFGSARKSHGRYQPHAKGEEGEWRDVEDTEEIEHQIITQAATSNLLTEIQNSMSELSPDIHDSQVTAEQNQIINSEVELVTGGISTQPYILSTEDNQVQPVVSVEIRNTERLTDIIEQPEKPRIDVEIGVESTLLNDQEMESIITKTQDDAFIKHVYVAVTKDGNESPDHKSASEVNDHSTCVPVELNPETQVMSDMQINIDNIHTVISDKNQNISKEHLENPMNRESEPEQRESTSPFVQIQESKPLQVELIKENVEFSSSEKRRKMGSTRKSLRGQIPGSNQKNTFEEIKAKENIQEENNDQISTNTGVIKEENNDTKEEIIAGETENFSKEDIATGGLQQYMLCELSFQTTGLDLSAIEHLSPGKEHPDFKEDDGNSLEPMENTNAQISMQTQTKKKKKFGSTRKPHGRYQPHAKEEEGEWRDVEDTEEIEYQIITQAATSNLLTEIQNSMSEVSLDIHDSQVTTEQNQIIKSEVELVTGGISAQPSILSTEDDQVHFVVSDEVSNAEGRTDIIEEHEKLSINMEIGVESTLLNDQEMESIITKTQDYAFIKHVSLAVKKDGNESPVHESASEVNIHSTCGPVQLIPETQAMSGMQINIDNIHTVISDQNQRIFEEHLENPINSESEPVQLESTSPFVQIQESKPCQLDVVKENVEFSSSEKKRKIGSTRKRPRGQIPGSDQKNKFEETKAKENIQEENTDQKDINTGAMKEANNDTEEEINAGRTENFTKEDITTGGSQQYMLCEISSQITDLDFTTIKHPLPATEQPDVKEADGISVETMEKTNAEIHMQTQTRKKKKFGSTRKPHGRHQQYGEEKECEWKDVEDIEEIEHQIITQAATSSLLTEIQNSMSEVSLDAPSLRTEEGMEYIKNESANQLAYPTPGPMEIIPETQARLDMAVLSEDSHTVFEDHLENPKNRELEPEQCESTCPTVHIQELNLALDDMATQTSEHNISGRRKKIGSTRRSLRVIKEKENVQEQRTEESFPTSEKDHAKKGTLALTSEVSNQSIQTHSEPLNIIEPQAENIGVKCIAKDTMVMPDSIFCDTETRVQEYEPQIHNKFDQSDGSLLSEIEFYMNKSFESPLNTTAPSPNISKFSEPTSEGSLQLPSSQNPQIHMEMSSPTRRRKMGSSRKIVRNKLADKISESSGSEQEKENLDNNNDKNSEPKIEPKTVKKTVMAAGTEDMKESVELMPEVQALSQINESSIQDTEQLLPEVRRKLGSRRTAKGSSGLGAFTHGEYESNQKKTDVQVTKDGLRVSDPYFISEPESTPISHPVSELRPEIEEVRKTVVKDINVSTEAGLVSLDNIKKTSPCAESTRERPVIDFEQWNEQLPDFGQAVYNVVMVGNSNVGKTSFIKRLQSGHFIPDYSATVGVDTFIQTVTFGNRTVKLFVWDTAGQERYQSITRQVFHKAQGLLLMYDITSSQSFRAVRAWISQIQENAPPDVILMLLGNKNDCAHREVQLQEGEDLSKEYNIHFMECSAATGENVSESLKTLAWLLVKQRVRKEEKHTTLQPKPQNKKSGCC